MTKMHKEELLSDFLVEEVYRADLDIYLKGPAGILQISINGDCCSTATLGIINIDTPCILTGEYSENSINGITTSQECDSIYVVELKSDDRYLTLGFEHRNSSNGYYGNYWGVSKIESMPSNVQKIKIENFW